MSVYGQKLGQKQSGKCFKFTGKEFSPSGFLIEERGTRKVREKKLKKKFFLIFSLVKP